VAGGEEYEYAAERRESRTDNRTEEEKKYVIVSGEGGKSALIERIKAPEITGAAVLCSGGDQPVVQERIYRAVSAALELPATKIYVTKIG
jgi:stage III sporulation protein AG